MTVNRQHCYEIPFIMTFIDCIIIFHFDLLSYFFSHVSSSCHTNFDLSPEFIKIFLYSVGLYQTKSIDFTQKKNEEDVNICSELSETFIYSDRVVI